MYFQVVKLNSRALDFKKWKIILVTVLYLENVIFPGKMIFKNTFRIKLLH